MKYIVSASLARLSKSNSDPDFIQVRYSRPTRFGEFYDYRGLAALGFRLLESDRLVDNKS